MKVLMINGVCGIGSTGRICTDLAEVLTSQGHECKIAYGRGIVPEKYQKFAVKIGTEFNVKLDALKTRIFDNAGFNSVKATKKFVEWIKDYSPDVIHLNNLHGYYLNVKILFDYLKICGKKIIWTLHDCWSFTGHCVHFDYVGCEKWKNACFACSQKRTYPKSFFVDKSKKNYELKKQTFKNVPNLTIVTPSKWLAELVKQSFLKDYPVQVINNGIDLEVFKSTSSDFRERNDLIGKKIILGVANIWDKRKGFDDFIKLSQIISEEYKIVLVGLNNKQLKQIPKNILGISRTNNVKELAEIYSAADVFVNTSVEETMGLTTVEAMACGTPVIVYNATAVPEVVCNNCGVIINKNDICSILKNLLNINKFEMNNDCQSQAEKYNKNDKYNEYINLFLKNIAK